MRKGGKNRLEKGREEVVLVKVKVKRIHPDAKIPGYAHPGDSGMDLYSVEDVAIGPGERKTVKTGLQISVPKGFEAQVRPKSGLAANFGITVLNTPGTIDSGYRGEVMVIMVNLGEEKYGVEKGKKIAQLVISRVEEAVVEETESLDGTRRNKGGFGSTGLG